MRTYLADRFRYCLNTSTLRGYELPLEETIRVAAKAGYGAIEPWIREIDRYVETGGSLPDLRRLIEDQGLTVEGAIGFFPWIVDDRAEREAALGEARRNMETLRAIGGKRLAAPPMGATKTAGIDPHAAAERFAALIDLGAECGVEPLLEVWGFSMTLGRLSEAAALALECGRDNPKLLLDSYHLYKGGSPFEGVSLLRGECLPVFHINDWPAQPPREAIDDKQRVYPGDGVAPLGELYRRLAAVGFDGWLSLELFNESYWKSAPLETAREGLEKTRMTVERAFE